jgi:hypothetical protein
LASVLVPGYGIGELAGRWKGGDDLIHRIGHSLGYGLAVDTAVLVIETTGFRFGGIALVGLDVYSLYFLVALGAVMYLVAVVRRRRVAGLPRVDKESIGVLGCVAVIGAIAWLYFVSYPIFPRDYNPDFIALVGSPRELISGTLTSIPRLVLYGAGYYQTAAAFLAVGSTGIQTAQVSMSILATLSPTLVYATTLSLTGDKRSGLLVTAIYSLSGSIWTQMVFVDGLYPNFVGTLLELVLLVTFIDLAKNPRSRSLWLLSAPVVLAAYFSHYSVLSVFGTFAILSLALAMMRSPQFKGTAVATIAFLIPGALGALAFRRQLDLALVISYTSGAPQPLTTYLSKALSFLPSIAYLAFDVRNDIGFLAAITLLAFSLYRGYKRKDYAILPFAIWFFALLIASPQDYAAWRFELEAIMPLTILAGYGLNSMIPSTRARKQARLRKGDPYKFAAVMFVLLFLTPIVATGWASSFTQSLALESGKQATVQSQVNATMTWLEENTPPSSSFLSVTDPTFLYSALQIGHNCTYEYMGNETQAISYARSNGLSYIIVTKHDVFFSQVLQPANDSAPYLPWFTYKPTAGVTLVYYNPNVRVFQVS